MPEITTDESGGGSGPAARLRGRVLSCDPMLQYPPPQDNVPDERPSASISSLLQCHTGPSTLTRPDGTTARLSDIVRELELAAEVSARRIEELEMELSQLKARSNQSDPDAQNPAPSLPFPPAPSGFDKEWRLRTEARLKLHCSLNRAGNALCAVHDSRRERRMYPPRMAPQGYLNCGCTHEEALFEESLARHGVGSFVPGEGVRMDPELRNPLLKLLQRRYGYRDGDFERDPTTGDWVKGEGSMKWEQKAGAAWYRTPIRSS